MNSSPIKGRIHSIQTLGTLDGPGVRFVLFLQGCPLRCGCCHNPDTWETIGGTEMTATEIALKVERYRTYYGTEGGITASGGEPLLQSVFLTELFSECKKRDINTCLDTSGCILNDDAKNLLRVTDRVLLDVKYPTDAQYRDYVGCGIDTPLAFLSYLNEVKIPVTLRQVILPTLNDTEENARFLAALLDRYPIIDKTELLPFRKLCTVKYERLGLDFRFGNLEEPTPECIRSLEEKIASFRMR